MALEPFVNVRGEEVIAVWRTLPEYGVGLAIKLAAAECGHGSERVRPPRLPLLGAEREAVLEIVRRSLRTRPVGGTR